MTRMINGPEAFTPDNEFILGESEVRGFFVAAGFCAHGIAGTGGIGQQMAHWIVDGEPELDLWKMDIRRFGGQYRSQQLTLARSYENYATYYDIHYPNEERLAGRPLRLSPGLRGRRGARRGLRREVDVGAPELVHAQRGRRGRRRRARPSRRCGRAAGRASTGRRRSAPRRSRRARPPALFDESSFAKIEIEGPGALGFLQRLCANDVDRPVGSITYTQMLNRRGGIECDFTVTRLARGPIPDRHRDRVRQPRPRLDPEAAAGRRRPGRAGPRRHVGARLLRDLGPARPRHPPAADEGRPVERGLPVHDRARDHARRRARARAPRDLRRRARLGAVLRRRSTGARCGARSGTRAASTASSPAATARSTRSGSRRATASGRATSRPRRRRTRRASGSR